MRKKEYGTCSVCDLDKGCEHEGELVDSKAIVIVGAGPGLGVSIARKFGREGFRVALVARNRAKLEQLVATLQAEGIAASAFLADVTDEIAMIAAFNEIKAQFGFIDVIEYSPVQMPATPEGFGRLAVQRLTTPTARECLEVLALGAVTAIEQVLPDMLERKQGTILITTGASAKAFMPMIGGWGIGMAAARNYAMTLGAATREHGVFVANICLGVQIARGDPAGDPDTLAATYLKLYRDRTPREIFINALPPEMGEIDSAATLTT